MFTQMAMLIRGRWNAISALYTINASLAAYSASDQIPGHHSYTRTGPNPRSARSSLTRRSSCGSLETNRTS